MDVLRWISPELEEWVRDQCRVPELLERKP
ncbi:hypothetical protein M2390_003012 [Mycetocola sp. BIGb0189]|nr:hypothetical protein [Mycetocola sp. BIGb0189]